MIAAVIVFFAVLVAGAVVAVIVVAHFDLIQSAHFCYYENCAV